MDTWPQLTRALATGLAGIALVDRRGRTVGLVGSLSVEEAMPLVALVMYRLRSADLAKRLFDGEILTLSLDDRDVAVGVARRQLFVVAILGTGTVEDVRVVRNSVAAMLAEPDLDPILPAGGGGSGSGPADLPVIELGITVPRAKA